MSFKVIEGDLLGHYKSFNIHLQAIPKEKGSVVQWTMEFEKQQNHIPDPHSTLQLAAHLTNKIDSYLTQNRN